MSLFKPLAFTKKPQVWCFSTYFAEGTPYMIVRILSSVFFTDIGAKERYIGYLNFLGIPWNLKFLWAPFVDMFSTKRQWLVTMQLIIAALTMGIALINYAIPTVDQATSYLLIETAILVIMSFVSATNDIAIDAYYIEGLKEKTDQAAYSGYRVFAYRLSMIYVRTGLVALVALVAAKYTLANPYVHWSAAFGMGGLTVLLLGIFHASQLPHVEQMSDKKKHNNGFFKTFITAFGSYFQQEKIALILAFLLVYKLGDEILFSMVSPFLLREIGLSKAQFSWVTGIVGAAGNIGGAMWGGIWIKRRGLKRSILPITLFMNLNIWAYIALAYFRPNPQSISGLSLIAFIHGYEQLAAGLGSSALLLFLLTTYKAEYKAAHYALGSALVSLFSHIFTGFAGLIVERIGYLSFYLWAFVASLPSLIMLIWVPIKENEPQPIVDP